MTERFALPPDQNGYAVNFGKEYAAIEVAGGLPRTRRDFIGSSANLSVSWTTDRFGYEYIRNAYRFFVASGAQPFFIDLIVGSGSLVQHIAKFVPSTVALSGVDGIRYTVTAQIEAYPGTVWPGRPGEADSCDCSTTAWQLNFNGVTLGGVTDYIGSTNDEFFREPLYGSGSRWWGAEASDEIYLHDPNVTIDGDWTVEFSIRFPNTSLNGIGDWELIDLYENGGDDISFRMWAEEYDDGGTPKIQFSLFWIPSFSQHEINGYLYDTIYDIAIVKSADRLRTFIGGVKVDDQSASGHPGAPFIDVMWNESTTTAQPIEVDEIRVSNVAKYDADYETALPFCTCPLDPVDIGWYLDPIDTDAGPAATTNTGQDDFTGSLYETQLFFALLAGPNRDVQILSWTPVVPESPPPVINAAPDEGPLSYSVQGERDPESNQLYDGVAHIGGPEITGYLILTMYHNGETGGYGGIAWSHS